MESSSALSPVSYDSNSIGTASYLLYPIDCKAEIRIIDLLPPTSHNPEMLRCTLTMAKLSDNPQYEALSWQFFAITENLAAALRRLRYPDRLRRLWVDAVCINQQNNKEKGHQVSLMAKVYKQAACGLCWLGEGTEGLASSIAANIAYLRGGINLEESRYRDYNDLYIWPRDYQQFLKTFLRQLEWRIVDEFFAQTWFDRLWVIQEFLLPNRVKFYNHDQVFNVDELDLFIRAIWKYNLMEKQGWEESEVKVKTLLTTLYIGELMKAKRGLRSTGTILEFKSLLQTVHQISIYGKRCQNDLDRIYALLGLYGDNSDILVEPSYDQTVEHVYMNFARQHIKQGRLDILHYVRPVVENRDTNTVRNRGPLPSWCPDWRCPVELFTVLSSQKFASATRAQPSLVLGTQYSPLIGVKGVFIDTIKELFSVGNLSPTFPAKFAEVKAKFCESFGTEKYHTVVTVNEAFVRSVVHNFRIDWTSAWKTRRNYGLWESCEQCLEYMSSDQVSSIGDLESAQERDYMEAALANTASFNLFMTKSGYFGCASRLARAGDTVVIFDGAETPFVLRKVAEKDREPALSAECDGKDLWRIIADCYLHDFMENEVLSPEYREKADMFWIT